MLMIWDEMSGQWFLGMEDMEWHPSIAMSFEDQNVALEKLESLRAAYPQKKLLLSCWEQISGNREKK